MKIIPKILKIVFVTIFILQMAGLVVLLFSPQESRAAIEFKPQITIPGSDFKNTATTTIGSNSIGKYIQAIYQYAIGIVGILATVVMMFGGFLYLTAGGDSSKISEAQEWIKSSLTGLIIAFSSYMILATVNPALVNLAEIKPTEALNTSTSSGNGQTGASCGSDPLNPSQIKVCADGQYCGSDNLCYTITSCETVTNESTCKNPKRSDGYPLCVWTTDSKCVTYNY